MNPLFGKGNWILSVAMVFTIPSTVMAESSGDGKRSDDAPLSLVQADSGQTTEEKTEQTEKVAEGSGAEDVLTEHQSVDAFNSLEDGQPGPPGTLELQLQTGWKTTSGGHDPVSQLTELQYNPNGSEFLRNLQLILGVPVEMGLGGVDGNADVELGWQQRWVRDNGAIPTLATLAEVRLPTGYDSSGVDGKLTGIVAKECGPGTLFLNGFVKTANGDNVEDLRHFQWGFRTGYKWRITEALAFIADYLNESSEEEGHANINALELSSMYHVNEHLTVGPGIIIGLDDNEETPNFGAGVRLQLSF